MEDWHKHFCEILEGGDEAVIVQRRNIGEDDEEDLPELANEEIEQQIQNLKKKKARDADAISGEALKYCKGSSRQALKEIVRWAWKGEGFQETGARQL